MEAQEAQNFETCEVRADKEKKCTRRRRRFDKEVQASCREKTSISTRPWPQNYGTATSTQTYKVTRMQRSQKMDKTKTEKDDSLAH